jgi:hypothetical protein
MEREIMASHPDANPDSVPAEPSDSPEQVSPSNDPGRENIEEASGTDAGTAGPDQRGSADITP